MHFNLHKYLISALIIKLMLCNLWSAYLLNFALEFTMFCSMDGCVEDWESIKGYILHQLIMFNYKLLKAVYKSSIKVTGELSVSNSMLLTTKHGWMCQKTHMCVVTFYVAAIDALREFPKRMVDQAYIFHFWRNVPHLLTISTTDHTFGCRSSPRLMPPPCSLSWSSSGFQCGTLCCCMPVHGYRATWGTMQHVKPVWEVWRWGWGGAEGGFAAVKMNKEEMFLLCLQILWNCS